MSPRRLAGLFALLVLLTGPLGLLAVEHGAFHRAGCDSADAGEHGAPCPVCHFLTTTSIEGPAPALSLPALVLVGVGAAALLAIPDAQPAFTPLRSRAPPALLS